jgi:hypothetical protein
MEDVGNFKGHLVHFTVIWYIFWLLDLFYVYLVDFPVLVCYTKKNLAALAESRKWNQFMCRATLVCVYIKRCQVFGLLRKGPLTTKMLQQIKEN